MHHLPPLQVREVLVEELRFGHKAIQDSKLEVSPRHRDPLGWVERGVVVVRQSVCLDVFLARPPRDVQLHLLNPKLVRELDQHQAQRILGGGELVQSKPVGAIVSGSRQGHRTLSSATARHTEDDEAKQRREQLQSRDGLERVATLVRLGDLSRRQLQGEPSSVTCPLRTCKFPAADHNYSGPPLWRRT